MIIGGIDIGGTKISIGFIDSSGMVIDFSEFITNDFPNPLFAIDCFRTYFNTVSRDLEEPIKAIGIGCTGPVFPETGKIGNVDFLKGWWGFDIKNKLSKLLDLPVFLENDADAAAIAEVRYGVGKNSSRFIGVTVGTGIGVGIIFDKRLYRGINGAHPEIGHHVIEAATGPYCSCGSNGCWEAMAGGRSTLLWAYNQFGINYKSTKRLYESANNGEHIAVEVVKNQAKYLSIGLSNIITIFAPDTISISGGMLRCKKIIMEEIRNNIEENCRLVPFNDITILPSALGKHAGLIGAACIPEHSCR